MTSEKWKEAQRMEKGGSSDFKVFRCYMAEDGSCRKGREGGESTKGFSVKTINIVS